MPKWLLGVYLYNLMHNLHLFLMKSYTELLDAFVVLLSYYGSDVFLVFDLL